ncbi:ribonuclease HII [Schumannella sp. 10F1B-5-1]|uniref:ribonuclease HII n=1 Tax=Schumannella sp. 10F1B-5-1 TaxID=2590780 RepID=UPI00113068AE|nr:ribonuclease HII [Schumannella sp. 10F1B-5-1]TPW72347.1 ribonuclease HII [Schumannella sp. 10F1B-5-1]
MTVVDPDLRFEKKLLRERAELVIGVDEVGRGAIAGPVAVGVSVIDARVARIPVGLRDSKLLSEKRREQLHPLVQRWARHSAVGVASNEEIDRLGIIAALGLAGTRALASVVDGGVSLGGARVILDGSHDWLTPALGAAGLSGAGAPTGLAVTTRVKADMTCASVAAASVLAKVQRDRFMIESHARLPEYNWVANKGYASSDHYAAIDRVGASDLHRWSWLRQPTLLDL